MKVKAIWEFDADISDFDAEQVDIEGLAVDSAEVELQYLLEHRGIDAEDFVFKVDDKEGQKNMTNYDRLRNFSIEQLGDFLYWFAHDGYLNPRDGWERWLKSKEDREGIIEGII